MLNSSYSLTVEGNERHPHPFPVTLGVLALIFGSFSYLDGPFDYSGLLLLLGSVVFGIGWFGELHYLVALRDPQGLVLRARVSDAEIKNLGHAVTTPHAMAHSTRSAD